MKIFIVSILMLLIACVAFALVCCLIMAKRADEELEHILLADKEIQKGR